MLIKLSKDSCTNPCTHTFFKLTCMPHSFNDSMVTQLLIDVPVIALITSSIYCPAFAAVYMHSCIVCMCTITGLHPENGSGGGGGGGHTPTFQNLGGGGGGGS